MSHLNEIDLSHRYLRDSLYLSFILPRRLPKNDFWEQKISNSKKCGVYLGMQNVHLL